MKSNHSAAGRYCCCHGHLDDFAVSAGDSVNQGDIIGRVGVSGKSTGPHLHMEVILEKTHLDPMSFIGMKNQLIYKKVRAELLSN